jgi:uncharacterized protein YyaL (SSP411 family)
MKEMSSSNSKNSNHLAEESSSYLLQHSNNPVDWYPYSDLAWNKAKEENKIVIVSIGYASCHWCHVMNHECFENQEIADVMNRDYINIKVDREERPDIDHVFMEACTIMIQRGGWPLNVFCLPDGRPIYAGTYFPPTSWKGLLHEIDSGYKTKPQKYLEFAEKLTSAVVESNKTQYNPSEGALENEAILNCYITSSEQFDLTNGGKGTAPKFPMPDIYFFLIDYHYFYNQPKAIEHTFLTLKKMALGGIYDQIGGGFSRYAVDKAWKVPHFEKMLYDNAQLLKLYALSYTINNQFEFGLSIPDGIVKFLKDELISPSGLFHSSMDADSEGEEGKFYVWTAEKIQSILSPQEYEFVLNYYSIDKESLWEKGNNILMCPRTNLEYMNEFKMDEPDFNLTKNNVNEKLLAIRNGRIKPTIDTKILLSWNCLLLDGFVQYYKSSKSSSQLDFAKQMMDFILNNYKKDDRLYRLLPEKGNTTIMGYLDDYAYCIQSLTGLYEVTFNEKYLIEAKWLLLSIMENFDQQDGFYFYSDKSQTDVFTKKIDIQDNVTPSSNGVLALQFFLLGKYFSDDDFIQKSKAMTSRVIQQVGQYGSFFSHWAKVIMLQINPFYEITINLPEFQFEYELKKINENYFPNKIVLKYINDSDLLQLEGKSKKGIYVCKDKTCQLPVKDWSEVRLEKF